MGGLPEKSHLGTRPASTGGITTHQLGISKNLLYPQPATLLAQSHKGCRSTEPEGHKSHGAKVPLITRVIRSPGGCAIRWVGSGGVGVASTSPGPGWRGDGGAHLPSFAARRWGSPSTAIRCGGTRCPTSTTQGWGCTAAGGLAPSLGESPAARTFPGILFQPPPPVGRERRPESG